MPEENAIVDYRIEGTNYIVTIDPNKNGVPLLEIKINMLEIPSEIISAISKKKD